MHGRLLAELRVSPEAISNCQELSAALETLQTAAHSLPLLRKPSNAITAWQLPEHRSWTAKTNKWHALSRKRVVELHLHPGKDVTDINSAIEKEEEELHALQVLARQPHRIGPNPYPAESPAVQQAIDRYLQQRRISIQESSNWMRESLAGPLLNENGRVFQYT